MPVIEDSLANRGQRFSCDYRLLAQLVTHPRTETIHTIAGLQKELQHSCPTAGKFLIRFGKAMEMLSIKEQQELYIRSFDVMPQCVPYLSVHLFGEESFKRSELMVGLRQAYADAGFDQTHPDMSAELPDHLLIVLKCAPHLPTREFQELVRFAIVPALGSMAKDLASAANPYRFLLQGIEALLIHDFGKECGNA